MSDIKHATDTKGHVVIYEVPSPSEVFNSSDGEVPDSWSDVARAGSEVGGKRSATLLQLISPKCCFLHPSRTFHRLNLMARSEEPRPGEGTEPFTRFFEVDLIRVLELKSGQLLNVTLQPWWATEDDYAQHYPDAAFPAPTREHTAFGLALRAGGSQ